VSPYHGTYPLGYPRIPTRIPALISAHLCGCPSITAHTLTVIPISRFLFRCPSITAHTHIQVLIPASNFAHPCGCLRISKYPHGYPHIPTRIPVPLRVSQHHSIYPHGYPCIKPRVPARIFALLQVSPRVTANTLTSITVSRPVFRHVFLHTFASVSDSRHIPLLTCIEDNSTALLQQPSRVSPYLGPYSGKYICTP
jgi:hypothetical protein